MNEYRFFDYHTRSHALPEVSRFDLWVSSVALALYAFALGATVTSATSAGEFALRAGFTLLLAGSTTVLFRSALLWGKPLVAVPTEPRQLRYVRRRLDSDREDGNARAA